MPTLTATLLPEAHALFEVDRRSTSYVRWVQTSLNGVLNSRLGVDGVLGPRTRAAVRAFQTRTGLTADGVVGPRTEAALVAAGASPPPGAGPTPTPVPPPVPGVVSPPGVLGRSTEPPLMSLYLDIPLGGEAPARSMTGLFVPANFQRTPTVDIVIYLHGFKRDGPSLSISSYWNGRRFPQRALREGVNTSGKNVLLVAPTLGPRSQAGRLVASGGFDDYVDRVRAGIGRHVYASTGQPPDLGTIIVAAHSGGGEPMRRAVLGSRRYAANIRECWGFDCLYSGVDAEQWARWARAHPAARLFVYFTDGGGTKAHSLALRAQGVPNVLVERSPAPHDYVPITHWAGRLAAAPLANTR